MSTSSNFAEFAQELDRFAVRVPAKANLLKRKVAQQILRGVVLRTPVDTGHARANWQTSLGTPETNKVALLDKNGQGVIARGTGIIAQSQPGEDIWISNNLPYIDRLEKGHSRQAPAGMVAQTLAAVKAQFSA